MHLDLGDHVESLLDDGFLDVVEFAEVVLGFGDDLVKYLLGFFHLELVFVLLLL